MAGMPAPELPADSPWSASPQTGGRIHSHDPFAPAERERSSTRRFRGRLAAAVTLWTAPGPAGLTVSSMMLADGDPARVLGLVHEDSDLFDALREVRRFAVSLLGTADRRLADRFAGVMPSPGGLFATGKWTETPYGPIPAHVGTWVGCSFDGARPVGWSQLVEGTVERVEVKGEAGLFYYRGHYGDVPEPGSAST